MTQPLPSLQGASPNGRISPKFSMQSLAHGPSPVKSYFFESLSASMRGEIFLSTRFEAKAVLDVAVVLYSIFFFSVKDNETNLSPKL